MTTMTSAIISIATTTRDIIHFIPVYDFGEKHTILEHGSTFGIDISYNFLVQRSRRYNY